MRARLRLVEKVPPKKHRARVALRDRAKVAIGVLILAALLVLWLLRRR